MWHRLGVFIISAFISFFRFIYIIGSYSLLLLTIPFSFVNHSGLGFPFGVVWLFFCSLCLLSYCGFHILFFSSKVFLTLAVSGFFVYFFLGSFCFFVSRDRLDFWLAGNGEIPGIVLCFFSFSF